MKRRAGFSLVELMVVIFIIGLLVALLLPAIQGAREAARRVHCRNNLKQLALAAINFEDNHRRYATENEATRNQPTWITLLFPYIEEDALFNEWAKAAGYNGPIDLLTINQRRSLEQVVATPVTILYCPSRRPPRAFDIYDNPWRSGARPYGVGARSDYALNGGASNNPDEIAVKLPGIWEVARPMERMAGKRIHQVRAKDVKDGLSSTYLIGEKAVTTENYENGKDPGDHESAFRCPRGNCVRFAKRTPNHDVSAIDNCWSCHSFGSAHLTHWHVAYCDGSVHAMSYDISFFAHKALATRAAADRGDVRN
jgi:prepilin-type N-terminal cleavage/methylation domain-containing protein